MSYVPSRRF